MRLIKQNDTSKPIVFLMVDSADHITGKTGLTPTVTISKNGGAFAAPAGAVSEIGDGWYKLTPAAADVDTLGPLIIHATATGADPTDVEYQVVARDPYTNQTDLNMDQALPASPTPNTVGASLVAANQEGQPTAVLFPVTPPFVDLPASGTKMCRIWLLVFDGNMQPLDLAANPTVTAENHAGQDRSTKLGPVTKETGSVGRYYVDYTASASDAEECIYVRVNFSYNGIDRQQIVSMVAVRDLGAEPLSLTAGPAATIQDAIAKIYARLLYKVERTGTQIKVYKEDDTTVILTSNISQSGSNQLQGRFN